eukprot:scaffold39809_cov88-Cyclotella_meneghiniana.AAC.1
MQSRRKRLESTIASLEGDLLAKKQQLNELREEEEAIIPLVPKELFGPNEDTSPVESSVAILLDGKVGCVPRRELIYLSDVLDSIELGTTLEFPNNYKRDNYGTKEFVVPPGITTIATKDWGKYQRDHERMKRLRKLMKGKKCTFSHEAQMIMGCGYHCNSGGSDEASIHIQAATLRALFFDMGIPDYEVSNLMIARALPSRTQVRNIDLRLGANCFLCVCWEIYLDHTQYISLQFDHGKRKGIEHFLKVISWGGYDRDENRVIKAFCIDASMCGHTALEGAESIKEIIDLLKILLPNMIVNSASSDSGGGTSIGNVFPILTTLLVVASFAVKNHCATHAWNKPLENGLKVSLGDAGMTVDSPFQMTYVGNLFLNHMLEQLGRNEMDEIWAEVNDKILNDSRFQRECLTHGGLTFSSYYDNIQELSEENPDDIMNLLYTLPTGRKDPVFSRWLTVLKAIDVFLDHYFTLYILAIRVKQQWPSNSLARTYACRLLSLMRIKPDSTADDEDDEHSPVFYTVLLFVQAFGRAYFFDKFHWIMRHNPNFGRGTYGHLSPYCAEFAFVAHRDLKALERGRFLDNPHFDKYKRAVETIPENHNVEAAGSAYFNRYPKLFFNQFRKSLDEHFLSHWKDKTHLPYLIGGTPSIANAFIRYLNDTTGTFGGYETSSDVGSTSSSEDEQEARSACSEPSGEAETSDVASASSEHVSTNTDGDEDDGIVLRVLFLFFLSPSNLFVLFLDEDETTFQYFYQFEDREVELPHLEMDNGPVTVNIRDCMLYLLSDVDPFQLRENTILSQQWPLLKEAAESGQIIDFYNPETWGDDKTKYNPVLDIIHQQIAPNSHEQH